MADLGRSQVRQVENPLNSPAGQGLPIGSRPNALGSNKSKPDSDPGEFSRSVPQLPSIIVP